MKIIRIIALFILITLVSGLSGNVLKEYYHANHGAVERVVFVFSEYPRYRIREDVLSVNLSFLDTSKLDSVKSKRVLENPVISKITFVPTDAFVGVLINTFQDYGLDHFVIKSQESYKLVLDIFQHKEPLSSLEAQQYADFYEKTGDQSKAQEFMLLSERLKLAELNKPPVPVKEVVPETKPDESDISIQQTTPKPVEEQPVKPEKKTPPTPPKTPIAQEKTTQTEDTQTRNSILPDRVSEVLEDIYHDRMLMFSIIVVFGVIIIMLIMSLIRKFHKKKKPQEEKSIDSFGTVEFQRVTIKRLLANGWQVEEIARELNLTKEEVENMGR